MNDITALVPGKVISLCGISVVLNPVMCVQTYSVDIHDTLVDWRMHFWKICFWYISCLNSFIQLLFTGGFLSWIYTGRGGQQQRFRLGVSTKLKGLTNAILSKSLYKFGINTFPQWSQVYGFTGWCVIMCSFKWLAWVYVFSHWSHLKGLSPVCCLWKQLKIHLLQLSMYLLACFISMFLLF